MTHRDTKHGLSALDQLDLALATQLVGPGTERDPLAVAQRALDSLRRPSPSDAAMVAGLLRLRGFLVDDNEAAAALAGRRGTLSPITQEYRLLQGLGRCLRAIRERALAAVPPDGWFLVDLFRTMTSQLPRFRSNEIRRSQPWDAVLYVDYPAPDQLRHLLDGFDLANSYRDVPIAFQGLHPVRQGFRILWRFARIAPFPDFNLVVAWLAMNAWQSCHGYPLLAPQQGDQGLLARLLSGPPPHRLAAFEARLLGALTGAEGSGTGSGTRQP